MQSQTQPRWSQGRRCMYLYSEHYLYLKGTFEFIFGFRSPCWTDFFWYLGNFFFYYNTHFVLETYRKTIRGKFSKCARSKSEYRTNQAFQTDGTYDRLCSGTLKQDSNLVDRGLRTFAAKYYLTPYPEYQHFYCFYSGFSFKTLCYIYRHCSRCLGVEWYCKYKRFINSGCIRYRTQSSD